MTKFIVIVLIVGLVLFLIDLLLTVRLPKPAPQLNMYVGLPGSGKTTIAAAFAKDRMKKGYTVYSNVPILGTYKVDKDDFGQNQIENCEVELDEAGIAFNNRVLLSQNQVAWFKYHRHYNVGINFFSQRSDCEITIRSMTYNIYLVKKSMIPYFVTFIRYPMKLQPNETRDNMTPQFADPRKVFDTYRVFCPKVWKMFDSWEAPKLNEKDFIKWEQVNQYIDDPEFEFHFE